MTTNTRKRIIGRADREVVAGFVALMGGAAGLAVGLALLSAAERLLSQLGMGW